jgi:methionine-rich copper-binding protein CopC
VETYPDDGASLPRAPEELVIWLDEPLRLTLFAVSGPAGMVKLTETSEGSLEERHYAIPEGPFEPGEYRIVWRGTAAVGTESSGGFRFVIEE